MPRKMSSRSCCLTNEALQDLAVNLHLLEGNPLQHTDDDSTVVSHPPQLRATVTSFDDYRALSHGAAKQDSDVNIEANSVRTIPPISMRYFFNLAELSCREMFRCDTVQE